MYDLDAKESWSINRNKLGYYDIFTFANIFMRIQHKYIVS